MSVQRVTGSDQLRNPNPFLRLLGPTLRQRLTEHEDRLDALLIQSLLPFFQLGVVCAKDSFSLEN